MDLKKYLDEMIDGYIECAIWSSVDDNGLPLDEFDLDDFSAKAMATIKDDCSDFLREHEELLMGHWDADQAGHDFWLTRNHHGTGFWDRGKEQGDALTKAAVSYGATDVYLGEDGLLHLES